MPLQMPALWRKRPGGDPISQAAYEVLYQGRGPQGW